MNENEDKILFSRLSGVLDEGTVYTAHNEKLGDIQVRHGNKSKGLVHIISRRYSERVLSKKVQMPLERAQTEITAICFLIADSLNKGSARATERGNWEIENKGIKAIIDKDKDGKFVLTGYDDNKNKTEATDSINAVIANYKYAPEFLEMYAQVGAVISSMEKITQNKKLSTTASESDFATGETTDQLLKRIKNLTVENEQLKQKNEKLAQKLNNQKKVKKSKSIDDDYERYW